MPNTENINKLIEVINNENTLFNMYSFEFDEDMTEILGIGINNCGTPACIAGWTSHIMYGDVNSSRNYGALSDWLGIGYRQSQDLFEPPYVLDNEEGQRIYWDDIESDPWFKITREQAIQTLIKLRDTGVVDWSHVDHLNLR